MLSTVFNPCSNTISSFLSDWNERGWIVIHQGNLTSDYQIFFLLTFEEITDVFFVFNSVYSFLKDGSIDQLNTIAMFTMEGGLMFRTFAQFLFKLPFPEGQGGMKETFGNSRGEGGGGYFFHKNGNSGEVGGLSWNSLHGGGMDIFWNYTMELCGKRMSRR